MRTILHADGDRELLKVYQSLLTKHGFRVLTAAGGLECVEKMLRFSPDVLVLALELPWGGGDGVLAVMREDPRRFPARVILTSALAPEEALLALGSPPVVAALAKPFSLSALLEHVAPEPAGFGARRLAAGAAHPVLKGPKMPHDSSRCMQP